MGKRLVTAADVRSAAQSGQQKLVAPAGNCIITPMARDEAITLGITIDDGPSECPQQAACVLGTPTSADALVKEVTSLMAARLPAGYLPADLEGLVREVVAAKLQPSKDKDRPPAAEVAQTAAVQGNNRPEGVRLIDGQRLINDNGTLLPVDEKMLVADAIGEAADDRLAGGYMVWEKAAFNRQVEAPEIAVVLEGEVELRVGNSTLKGKPGDMVYLPKDTAVTYNARSKVKLACINCI